MRLLAEQMTRRNVFRWRTSNTPICRRAVLITACGRICIYQTKINTFPSLAGRKSWANSYARPDLWIASVVKKLT